MHALIQAITISSVTLLCQQMHNPTKRGDNLVLRFPNAADVFPVLAVWYITGSLPALFSPLL